MALEIMQVLVCSTAHVTKEEAAKSDKGELIGIGSLGGPMVWEYGWLYYVGGKGDWDPDQEELSEGFAGAIKVARANGLEWIRFDRDADKLEGVPSYDW